MKVTSGYEECGAKRGEEFVGICLSLVYLKRKKDSVIYFDGWCGYDGLAGVGYCKYYSVRHG